MGTSKKTIRGLMGLGLAVGLVAAACSSSSPNVPNVPGGGGGGGGGGGNGLTSGLAANLAALDSYKFSWSFTTASSTSSAASLTTSGTVINKPAKAYKIDNLGMIQIIVVADKSWMSYDNGATWNVDDTYKAGSSSLNSLLPDSMYGTDFDSNAGQFSIAGNEKKNGVDCVHYQGSTSLGALGAVAGVNANFKSDLWVAKSGNYPVSGFYGWSASSGGDAGTWGYSFDVTNVNDASNKVDPPTNVVALPSF